MAYEGFEGRGDRSALRRMETDFKGGRGRVYGSDTPKARQVNTENTKSTEGEPIIWGDDGRVYTHKST